MIKIRIVKIQQNKFKDDLNKNEFANLLKDIDGELDDDDLKCIFKKFEDDGI